MHIVPAMDLRHGQCVYTERDKNRFEHARYVDPLDVAEQWVSAGIDHIHIIDLDGYQYKEPRNVPTVRRLVKQFPRCEFEICGGVCQEEHILIWQDTGVHKIVVTKSALRDADTLAAWCLDFADQIVLLAELKRNMVFGNISHFYGQSLVDFLPSLADIGLQRVILTEIETGNTPPDIPTPPTTLDVWLYLGRQLNAQSSPIDPFLTCGASTLIVGRAVHDGLPQKAS